MQKQKSEILHDDRCGPVIIKDKREGNDEIIGLRTPCGIRARFPNNQFSSSPIHPPKANDGEGERKTADD
jgi:hypothetical protein